MKKKTLIKLLILVILVSTYIFVEPVKLLINQAVFILQNVDVDVTKNYIISFGIWAPVISFFLMILQSLITLSSTYIITFANAGLFGWIKGAILSWGSAMIGAILCFGITRFYGRSLIEKLIHKGVIKAVDDFFDKYGNYAVLIARLLPFVSFNIISYLAGLTKINFWSFVIATGIGQLPVAIVYSYVGGTLTGTTKTIVTGLSLLFALFVLIAMGKKIYSNKKIFKIRSQGKIFNDI